MGVFRSSVLLGSIATSVLGSQAHAQDKGDLRVYHKSGLRFETEDKSVKMKIGGRIMNDWGFFDEDAGIVSAFGKQKDGTEFRRARLYLSGTLHKRVVFKAQYDFAGGDPEFKDMFLGLKDVPCAGTVRVGRYKEPFSIEELTSSKYPTFMERSLPNAMAPGRNTGISMQNTDEDEDMTWSLGVFRQTDDFGDSGGGSYSVTGRVTGLPWRASDDQLLHVGVGVSHRQVTMAGTSFAIEPEAHLASDFVDTGTLAANSVRLLGFEMALVNGPFSAQVEVIHAGVDMRASGDVDLLASYVYVSYFLTGENRVYESDVAEFGRIKPSNPFGVDGGNGAVEIGVRYSRADFTDGAVTGGELNDVTFGVNWYLNSNTRAMFNYVFADLDGIGEMHTIQARFQVDF